ncbi:MAG: hypothetical protein BGO78_07055 [Chloroflexi bacterium 44-23]|nr:MAG: hypothetical protein BGO78_07055 [Chloroflexi bacterium 44-23]
MKNKYTLIFILVLLLLALASITWLSSYTRLYADDYCIGADAQVMDLSSFFQKWYSSWTGRFSYISLAGVLALGGTWLAGFLPGASLILWLLALTWALLPLVSRCLGAKSPLASLTLGALLILILFASTPNLFQSFFWRDGLINYTFPLIGFTFVGGFLLRSWLDPQFLRWWLLPVFFLSLISGGFSEVFSVMQVSTYGLLILVVLLVYSQNHKQMILSTLFAALAGGLIALILVALAPGNAVRQSLMVDHPGILRLVTFSARNALFIATKFFIQTPGWAFLTVLSSTWIGLNLALVDTVGQTSIQPKPRAVLCSNWFSGLVLIPLITFMILVSACAPVVYILNAYPDDRTIYLSLFVLIIATILSVIILAKAAFKQALGKSRRQIFSVNRWLTVIVVASVFAAAAFQVSSAIQRQPEYRDYAESWDVRDQEIQSKAEQNVQQVIVPGLASRFGLSDLRVESDFWVNRCMAEYYQIPFIIGR